MGNNIFNIQSYQDGACEIGENVELHPFAFLMHTHSLGQVQSWKPSTVFLRLDFLKCFHISVFFKTHICTESVSSYSRHCTDMRYYNEKKI